MYSSYTSAIYLACVRHVRCLLITLITNNSITCSTCAVHNHYTLRKYLPNPAASTSASQNSHLDPRPSLNASCTPAA